MAVIPLKQSTAVTVLIGPFLDDTDGKTAETALTISQADVRLSKNGGNMAQKGDTTSCTHDELGYYTCPLSTADTGTVGLLKIMVHESGALPVWQWCVVLPAMIYDSVVGGTDRLDTNVTHVADTSQTANDNGADINTLLTRIVGTLATGTHNPQSGDTFARIGANGGSLTGVPWNSSWDAEVQSECTDALNAYDPPTRAELTSDISGLNDPTAAAIADAVWDEAKSGHTSAGSFGEEVQSHALSTEISALNDITADEVWDATSATLSTSFEVLMDRIYQMTNNKMTVNESTGAVDLRNIGDSASIATGSVTSSSGTTTRAELSFA